MNISSTRGVFTFGVVSFVTAAVMNGTAQRGVPEPPPARDGQVAATGTSAIAGTVVTDDAARRPLRRATVAIRNIEFSTARTTISDDAGRFAFADLPEGRFTLSVAKPAYVTTSYGATMPRGQGLAIALAAGQRVTDLVVRVPRGAVISGRVVDENGVPAAGLRVGVSERISVNGEATYRAAFGAAQVDDRGMYRLYGLAAGTYVVSISSGLLSGPIGGAPRVATQAEVQWALRGAASSPGAAQPPAPPRGPGQRYATLFYPGTTDPSGASQVTIEAGEERTGIDFIARFVPTSSLEGSVARADGQPVRGVQILPVLMTRTMAASVPEFPTRASVTPDGKFSVSGLAPGRYLVSARAPSALSPAPAPGGRGTPAAVVADLWAAAEIDVAGHDISGVLLTLVPGMTVSGRIAFDAKARPVPTDLTTVRLNLGPPPGFSVSLGVPSAQADADGTFKISGIAPGSFLLNASITGSTPMNPTWVLKSALLGGRDIIDTPFEVRPNTDTTDVVVTFTDQVTQLSGSLTDRAGRPAPGYFVIVFTTNSAHWRQGSRWLRVPTRPATDGRFTISGLPPGEYYLAALTEFQQNEWYTPAFLQQLVPMSLMIVLGDGEKKVQDLKLAGG
jgi:Carboxypeptidase regulatory-like domain